jgi:hypothetical protein
MELLHRICWLPKMNQDDSDKGSVVRCDCPTYVLWDVGTISGARLKQHGELELSTRREEV